MSKDQIIIIDPDQQPDIHQARDLILKLLSEGLTVQVIAARLNLDPSKILSISDEVRAQQRQNADNGQKLSSYLNRLDEIIELAHWQCRSDPMPANVYAYTALLETARGLVQDLDGRRDNEQLTSELVQTLLGPMMLSILERMTQKLSDVRQDLNRSTSAEQQPRINQQIESILRELASIQNDQLIRMRTDIKDTLDSAHPESKTKALTKRAPKTIGKP